MSFCPNGAKNTRRDFERFQEAADKRARAGLAVDGHVWRPGVNVWEARNLGGGSARTVRYGRAGEFRDGRGRVDGAEMRAIGPLEFRAEASKPGKIFGYAALYNSLSEDLGGFYERMVRGCFRQCLTAKPAPDIRAAYNHEELLARTSAGTLRLADTAAGLAYEIDVADTQVCRDLVVKIQRGDVTGSSFCFCVNGADGEAWSRIDGQAIRELRNIELLECGPVDCPAYLGTQGKVGLRLLPSTSFDRMTESLAGDVGQAARVREWKLRLAEAECGTGGTPRLDFARAQLQLLDGGRLPAGLPSSMPALDRALQQLALVDAGIL